MSGLTTEEQYFPSNEISHENGLLALNHLNNVGLYSLIEECGYDPLSQRRLERFLDSALYNIFEGQAGISNEDSYRGDYIVAGDDTGLELRLFLIQGEPNQRMGYHIAVLDKNQHPDNRIFEGDRAIFELFLLLGNDTVARPITPEEVFLEAMRTRGHNSWKDNKYWANPDWINNCGTINFRFLLEPLTRYEFLIRNYGKHNLNGAEYHTLIRMVRETPKYTVRKKNNPSLREIMERFTKGLKSAAGSLDPLGDGVYVN